MKFICQNCKKEAQIKVFMSGCVVVKNLKINDNKIVEYGNSMILDCNDSQYQCSNCNSRIPLEVDTADEEILIDWLSEQEYNK